MKLAIVGPFYPWRGGIAHHTGSFANHLVMANVPTEIFSFSTQYSKIIYPGKSQKESGDNPFPKVKAYFILNPLNPITWLTTLRLIIRSKPSICIFKYWHFYFAPCFFFLAFFLRLKGFKTACIIDNLYTHEGHFLDKMAAKVFFPLVDLSITQSINVDNQFSSLFLKNYYPHIIIPHPIYDNFGPSINPLDARKQLSLPLDKVILLFFGFIRPYKGLDILLQSLGSIVQNMPNIHLLIAGECFGSFTLYQDIIDNNRLQNFVTTHISYIENSKIPLYFSAAHIFMMPYRSVTNSGVMEIAKNYNLPVITSDIPAFKNYSTLMVDFSHPDNVLSSINKVLSDPIKYSKEGTSWEEFVSRLLIILERL